MSVREAQTQLVHAYRIYGIGMRISEWRQLTPDDPPPLPAHPDLCVSSALPSVNPGWRSYYAVFEFDNVMWRDPQRSEELERMARSNAVGILPHEVVHADEDIDDMHLFDLAFDEDLVGEVGPACDGTDHVMWFVDKDDQFVRHAILHINTTDYTEETAKEQILLGYEDSGITMHITEWQRIPANEVPCIRAKRCVQAGPNDISLYVRATFEYDQLPTIDGGLKQRRPKRVYRRSTRTTARSGRVSRR